MKSAMRATLRKSLTLRDLAEILSHIQEMRGSIRGASPTPAHLVFRCKFGKIDAELKVDLDGGGGFSLEAEDGGELVELVGRKLDEDSILPLDIQYFEGGG